MLIESKAKKKISKILFKYGMINKEVRYMIWDKFKGQNWKTKVDVSDFIRNNYQFYDGDETFLEGTTERTNKVWSKCSELLKEELKKGVLDIDVNHASGINNYEPGYIDKENEVIVGLQTDKPLKRIVNPYGGIRMV